MLDDKLSTCNFECRIGTISNLYIHSNVAARFCIYLRDYPLYVALDLIRDYFDLTINELNVLCDLTTVSIADKYIGPLNRVDTLSTALRNCISKCYDCCLVSSNCCSALFICKCKFKELIIVFEFTLISVSSLNRIKLDR